MCQRVDIIVTGEIILPNQCKTGNVFFGVEQMVEQEDNFEEELPASG